LKYFESVCKLFESHLKGLQALCKLCGRFDRICKGFAKYLQTPCQPFGDRMETLRKTCKVFANPLQIPCKSYQIFRKACKALATPSNDFQTTCKHFQNISKNLRITFIILSKHSHDHPETIEKPYANHIFPLSDYFQTLSNGLQTTSKHFQSFSKDFQITFKILPFQLAFTTSQNY
jgi:hypothetical protein